MDESHDLASLGGPTGRGDEHPGLTFEEGERLTDVAVAPTSQVGIEERPGLNGAAGEHRVQELVDEFARTTGSTPEAELDRLGLTGGHGQL